MHGLYHASESKSRPTKIWSYCEGQETHKLDRTAREWDFGIDNCAVHTHAAHINYHRIAKPEVLSNYELTVHCCSMDYPPMQLTFV